MPFGYCFEYKGDPLDAGQGPRSCACVKRFQSKNNHVGVLPQGAGLSFVFSFDLDLWKVVCQVCHQNPWNAGEGKGFEVSFAETELFINVGKQPPWFQEGWKSRTVSLSVWNNMQPLATCFTPKGWACTVKISAGGRRRDGIMSFLQKWSRSSLSRLICPLLFGIHQIHPFNISRIVQVTSTELGRLLCACISPLGLAGLRSLSRLSLKSLKWTKQEIVSTQNLG